MVFGEQLVWNSYLTWVSLTLILWLHVQIATHTHSESSARLFTIRFNQASTSAATLHAILGSVGGVQQQKWMPGTFVGEQWWVTTSDSPSDE